MIKGRQSQALKSDGEEPAGQDPLDMLIEKTQFKFVQDKKM